MKKILLSFVLGAVAAKVYAQVLRAPVRYSVEQRVIVRPLDGSSLAQLQAALEDGGYTIISRNVVDNSILASQVILTTTR